MNLFITGLSISVAVLLGAVLKPKIEELGKREIYLHSGLLSMRAFPSAHRVSLLYFVVTLKKTNDGGVIYTGLLRKIVNVNNQRCSRIKGLEACEDIFIDQPTGKAYLACSHREHRANWVPAINILKLSAPSFLVMEFAGCR